MKNKIRKETKKSITKKINKTTNKKKTKKTTTKKISNKNNKKNNSKSIKKNIKKTSATNLKKKFVSNSRLSKLQRKYCSCIMDVRANLVNSKSKTKNNKSRNDKSKTNNSSKNKSMKKKSNVINNNPYAICYSSIRKSKNMNTTLKKREQFKKELNPSRTNCVMNYEYNSFSLQQVQEFAKERNIPITYKKKNGKLAPYKISTLSSMITRSYLSKQGKTRTQQKKLKLLNNSSTKMKNIIKKRSVRNSKKIK